MKKTVALLVIFAMSFSIFAIANASTKTSANKKSYGLILINNKGLLALKGDVDFSKYLNKTITVNETIKGKKVKYIGKVKELSFATVSVEKAKKKTLEAPVITTTCPKKMEIGKKYNFTVSIKNTTGKAWESKAVNENSNTGKIALRSSFDKVGDGTLTNDSELKFSSELPAGTVVKNGETAIFKFNDITVDDYSVGTYRMKLMVVKEGFKWFPNTLVDKFISVFDGTKSSPFNINLNTSTKSDKPQGFILEVPTTNTNTEETKKADTSSVNSAPIQQ